VRAEPEPAASFSSLLSSSSSSSSTSAHNTTAATNGNAASSLQQQEQHQQQQQQQQQHQQQHRQQQHQHRQLDTVEFRKASGILVFPLFSVAAGAGAAGAGAAGAAVSDDDADVLDDPQQRSDEDKYATLLQQGFADHQVGVFTVCRLNANQLY
jgi:transcription initiation factor TFIID subunit TAF12